MLPRICKKKMTKAAQVETSKRLNYENKIILAPMVRVGTLPMRLLALDYGADIVYTEEIIDWKFLKSTKRVNEKDKVVVQLGTSDPNRALQVAKLIESHVAGIDINMGCPKEFSLKGGMGAALLYNPEKAKNILSTLVQNLNIPHEDTLDLVKGLASSGISAIAVHGRTKVERPSTQIDVKPLEKLLKLLIYRGGSREIDRYSDIFKFKEECGSSSVMLARTAESNCSIFRKQGLKNVDDVIKDYLKYAVIYDNSPSNTKYCVQNMLKELQETPRGKNAIWGLGDYSRRKQLEYKARGILGRREIAPDVLDPKNKRQKTDLDAEEVGRCTKIANFTTDPDLPKSKLIAYCNKHKYHFPKAILSLNGKKYSSSYWEKNKKFAEQGAALVACVALDLISKETLLQDGSMLE
ncbi:hypothetical protein NQ317_003139 [Molorchus minor]|uniref:DUS-like FMN-binding domain-containing protein n=1 Tax=Molorchus minor TaxID=1323400 RepID=A0ABQ9K0D7_9CUCU|nr:hypothetical protein NQ317_003139 [Molorchus minor]